MDLTTAIAIRTYANEAVAQMAAMHLESIGIEAVIDADDCGGMRPELQVGRGVRILIDPSDKAASEEALKEYEAKLAAPEGEREDYSSLTRSSGFLWGCVVGALVVGGIVYLWQRQQASYSGPYEKDADWRLGRI